MSCGKAGINKNRFSLLHEVMDVAARLRCPLTDLFCINRFPLFSDQIENGFRGICFDMKELNCNLLGINHLADVDNRKHRLG